MILTLSPISSLRRPDSALSVAGEVLTVDGVDYDLTAVPEGGEGWPEGDHPFEGPIRRISGTIHAVVRAFLGPGAASVQPVDGRWVVDVAAGPVTIPAVRTTE